MATRIYVGGLPYSASEDDVNKLFAAHGTVTSATIITDKYTGQAKGFGFVEMATEDEFESRDRRAKRHPDGRPNADGQRGQAARRSTAGRRRRIRRRPRREA